MQEKVRSFRYKEYQYLPKTGLYAICGLLSIFIGLMIYALYNQLILKHAFGDRPAPNTVLIMAMFVLFFLIVAFRSTRLETQITKKSIKLGWRPFRLFGTEIKWKEVDAVRFEDFPFIGYGYKVIHNGVAYYMGEKVMRLFLKDGREVVVSTGNENELREIVAELGISKI